MFERGLSEILWNQLLNRMLSQIDTKYLNEFRYFHTKNHLMFQTSKTTIFNCPVLVQTDFLSNDYIVSTGNVYDRVCFCPSHINLWKFNCIEV